MESDAEVNHTFLLLGEVKQQHAVILPLATAVLLFRKHIFTM